MALSVDRSKSASPVRRNMSPTVRYDVERDGESALLQILEEIGDGEPPKRITITAEGIQSSWE